MKLKSYLAQQTLNVKLAGEKDGLFLRELLKGLADYFYYAFAINECWSMFAPILI